MSGRLQTPPIYAEMPPHRAERIGQCQQQYTTRPERCVQQGQQLQRLVHMLQHVGAHHAVQLPLKVGQLLERTFDNIQPSQPGFANCEGVYL